MSVPHISLNSPILSRRHKSCACSRDKKAEEEDQEPTQTQRHSSGTEPRPKTGLEFTSGPCAAILDPPLFSDSFSLAFDMGVSMGVLMGHSP